MIHIKRSKEVIIMMTTIHTNTTKLTNKWLAKILIKTSIYIYYSTTDVRISGN